MMELPVDPGTDRRHQYNPDRHYQFPIEYQVFYPYEPEDFSNISFPVLEKT